MRHQTVSVTEFKAKCLALLDSVSKHGGTITVTKRGRPLASVGPAEVKGWTSPEGMWKGIVEFPDDLDSPDTSERWDVVRDPAGQL